LIVDQVPLGDRLDTEQHLVITDVIAVVCYLLSIIPNRILPALPGSSLCLSADRTDKLIRAVRKGLSFKTSETLSRESGISISEVASIIEIPERTLARRKAEGRLARDESERLLRISSIFEKAVELFNGDVPEAVAWLRRPRRALADHAPLAYSGTELGAREVENLIGQLEYGVFP
jgi:putative toxin-antitoxin system antitoxin component (TIGR02293 family)